MDSIRRLTSSAGFTLIDTITAVTIFCILAAVAIPYMRDMTDTIRVAQGAREVERELQTARLKAVTSNRPMRVRFNCPTPGDYRMVEVIGSTTVPVEADGAANRCQETVYPYPAADRNSLTRPNLDGPLRRLHSSLTFGAARSLEFQPNGTVKADNGTMGEWPALGTGGTEISIVKGMLVKKITVNNLGKIQLAQ